MKNIAVLIGFTLLIFTACKPEKHTEMTKTNLEQFTKDYIEAWSTTDSTERQELIEKIYSVSSKFYANEPGDKSVEYQGLESIYKNITQVNQKLVIGNGLITESTGSSENNNTVRVTWQMKTPNRDIAMKGMNFLLLNKSGKIEKDFIFIN